MMPRLDLRSIHPPKIHAGFTLVEIMVVVAMISILASLAAPSWTQLRVRNLVRASVNDFSTSLQFARSQAVQLNSPVTLCPSSDGINCTATEYQMGWIVRLGANDNAAGQRVLQDVLAKDSVVITASHGTRRFTFLPNGSPSNAFTGSTVQIAPSAAELANLTRRLCINRAGRIRLSEGVC